MLILGSTVAYPDLGAAGAQADIAAAAAIARGCIRMHLDPSVSAVGLPPDSVNADLGKDGKIGLRARNRG